MSKLFMYGTSLEGLEELMVMMPNFQPRRSGIVINVNNRSHKCGYIGSDFKVNVGRCRYKDLVREYFGKINNYFLKKIKKSSK